MDELSKEELRDVFEFVDRQPLQLPKCKTAVELEPGVVALCTETGAPAVLMARETYEEILEWNRREDENGIDPGRDSGSAE